MTALAWLHPLAQAQAPMTPPPALGTKVAPNAPKPAAPVATKSGWSELSPLQQQSLKPLAGTWGSISDEQKRKWLELSKSYPNLSTADQAVMHSRMNEWVAMSPQQRAVARLNFAKTKELSSKLTAEEKKAKWQSYQALSPEEKAKLASKAAPKPAGAATAVKPVAQQKLAVTPNAAPPPKVQPAVPASTRSGDVLSNTGTPATVK